MLLVIATGTINIGRLYTGQEVVTLGHSNKNLTVVTYEINSGSIIEDNIAVAETGRDNG